MQDSVEIMVQLLTWAQSSFVKASFEGIAMETELMNLVA